MPLIFNGQVIAGDQRPVLEELNENSDYLVTSKGIADYVKNSGLIKPVEAFSEDGIIYTAEIPAVTELYNGFEITVIPNIDSNTNNTQKYAKFKLNEFAKRDIVAVSPNTTSGKVASNNPNYIRANAPLKLIYNAGWNNGIGAWFTNSVITVPVQSVAGLDYNNLINRIKELEEKVDELWNER